MTDTFSYDELDHHQSRTDIVRRAEDAEELATYQMLRNARLYSDRLERCVNLLRLEISYRQLIACGCTERQADLDALIAERDSLRATALLKTVFAANVIEELEDDFQRCEFACLVMRYENTWPDRLSLQETMITRFGWANAEDMLLRAVNESDQEISGLFFWDDEPMADAMQYPELLDDPNPYGVWRCFVSAEAQSHHGLHRIYRRWTYRSVFEADPS